jgi:Cu/Ag efflux protein CusF
LSDSSFHEPLYNSFMKTLLLFLALFLPGLSAAAETFQGEVVEVDRSQGRVTVRNDTINAQAVEHWVFNLRPSSATTDPFADLDGIDIGDEIQVNAMNQNGVWQVQEVVALPRGGAGTVFVANVNPPGARPAAVLATTSTNQPVNLLAAENNGANGSIVSTSLNTSPVSAIPANVPVSTLGVLTASSNSSQSAVTGINNLSTTLEATTVTPTGIVQIGNTSSGGSGSTFSGPGTTTSSGAAGTPTRNGAEGVPARSGAQGTSQSL